MDFIVDDKIPVKYKHFIDRQCLFQSIEIISKFSGICNKFINDCAVTFTGFVIILLKMGHCFCKTMSLKALT